MNPEKIIESNLDLDRYLYLRREAKRLSAEISSSQNRLDFARSFVASILITIDPDFPSFPNSYIVASTITNQISDLVISLDDLMSSYLIGSVYNVMLPRDYRSSNGIFYTPPSITEQLLDQVENQGLVWNHAKILDPACGGGAFLTPIVRRIKTAMRNDSPSKIIEYINNNLKGYEIDPFGAWMSDFFIKRELSDLIFQSKTAYKNIISIRDSLDTNSSEYGQFDLVIGNPPYGKIKLPTRKREKWARGLHGHANLYGLFVDLAMRLVNQKGLIAYVTPTSFLGGRYFKSLRKIIMQETPPVIFDFVKNREGVFADVQQETLLSVFKSDYDSSTSINYISINELGLDSIKSAGKINIPNKDGSPWIIPRTPEQAKVLFNLKGLPNNLESIGYKVSTGPLVWNRHKNKLFKTKVKKAIPLIWSECVDSSGNGDFTFKATRNHFAWFRPTPKDNANIIQKECILVQRTTSIEQKRRIIAALLPQIFIDKNGGNVTVENHINMIIPITQHPVIEPMTLLKIMNSEVVDSIFRCINGSTAVSAYELGSIPLPKFSDLKSIEQRIKKKPDQSEIDEIIEEYFFK